MRKVVFLCLLIRAANCSTLIAIYAGNGNSGDSGDGGAATSAQFSNQLGGMSVNSAYVYVADVGNNKVRRIEKVSGIISTYAGTGTASYNGDSIAATSAKLRDPFDVVLDTSSNLYILDYGNNRVRFVDESTQIITTVAGTGAAGSSGDDGPATSATLHHPLFGAIDSSGNFYFSSQESGYNSVRKITIVSRIITLVAGAGQGYSGDGGPATLAQFNQIGVLAIDSSGNVYIADGGNRVIRMVEASTGIVTSPTWLANLNYPTSIVFDSAGNMYECEGYPREMIKMASASNTMVSIIAGTGTAGSTGDGGPATAALFNNPQSIQFDTDGITIYVGDTNNYKIRVIYSVVDPTSQPTIQPTQQPSCKPSHQPTSQPTQLPSQQPSSQPTSQPSHQPTSQPSHQPSRQPSCRPTAQPTQRPTYYPTRQPTQQPSQQPSSQPTTQPSHQPTSQPSRPSSQPTTHPSQQPTSQPSLAESMTPSQLSQKPQQTSTPQASNALIGGVIGGILGVFALMAATYWIMYRRGGWLRNPNTVIPGANYET